MCKEQSEVETLQLETRMRSPLCSNCEGGGSHNEALETFAETHEFYSVAQKWSQHQMSHNRFLQFYLYRILQRYFWNGIGSLQHEAALLYASLEEVVPRRFF